MNKSLCFVASGLVSTLAMLIAAEPSRAQGLMPMRTQSQMFTPGSTTAMPFSPYRLPSQYAMPYSDMSTQYPYGAYLTSNRRRYGGDDGTGYGNDGKEKEKEQKKELPHRTGELRAAPPDAGAIKIALPEESAKVSMDGEVVSSAGLTRYFVTPCLDNGKKTSYEIKIEWTQNGERRTKEQKVNVAAGKIAVVDFTKGDKTTVTRKSSN
jgi:uncharacterized protein (TIGR03000 family)